MHGLIKNQLVLNCIRLVVLSPLMSQQNEVCCSTVYLISLHLLLSLSDLVTSVSLNVPDIIALICSASIGDGTVFLPFQ